AELLLARLNERLLGNLVFAGRTTCRCRQNVVRRRSTPAGYFVENPIECNVGIVQVTILAAADQLFSSSDHIRIKRHHVDSGPTKQLVAIETALQRPFLALLAVAQDVDLAFGGPYLQVSSRWLAPLIQNRRDLIGLFVKYE